MYAKDNGQSTQGRVLLNKLDSSIFAENCQKCLDINLVGCAEFYSGQAIAIQTKGGLRYTRTHRHSGEPFFVPIPLPFLISRTKSRKDGQSETVSTWLHRYARVSERRCRFFSFRVCSSDAQRH